MKKVLLCSGLFFCVLMSYSQKYVLASDSSFFSTDTGKTFVYYASNNYNYDAECLDSTLQSESIDPVSQTGARTKDLYTYYADGTVHTDINQTFSSSENIFTNSNRSTYTYNSQKQIATFYFDLWSDSSWIPSRYSTREYDSKGNITNRIIQIWSPETQEYVNTSRFLYTYNANEQQTSYITQFSNSDNSSWVNGSRSLNTYDLDGHLIAGSDATWDTNSSVWTLTDTATFYNNSAGLPDSSLQTFPVDNAYYLYYYNYYSASSLPYQATSFYYKNENLERSNRTTYFYDSTIQSHKDSVYSEYLYVPANIYVPDYSWSSTRLYNSDNTLKEYDSIYYAINPNDNIYSKTLYNYTNCSPLLPVTLLNFSGELKNKEVILHWTTANEINAAYYTIQRSSEGIHFTDIRKVTASGNNSSVNKYVYLDAAVALMNIPKAYYRLVQVDNNGKTTYTNIINIDITGRKLVVTFSPNPVLDALTIYTSGDLPNALISITDMNGKVLYTLHQNIMADARIVINTSTFAKGMYVVTIQSFFDKQQFKIIK